MNVNVKKRSLKMYNFGNRLVIGILENISAFNTVGMPGNFNDVTAMNESVNYGVGDNIPLNHP